MNTETPRTDAELKTRICWHKWGEIDCDVSADFASQLERELNEAKDTRRNDDERIGQLLNERDAWRKVADELATAIKQGNAHGYGLQIGDEALAAYEKLKGQ